MVDVRECGQGSVLLGARAWLRGRSARAHMRDARPPAPGSYCFYSLRRNASGQSRVLVPLIDMINHAGAGHNAHVAEAADGSISATATRDIAAGEEARPHTACADTPAHFCHFHDALVQLAAGRPSPKPSAWSWRYAVMHPRPHWTLPASALRESTEVLSLSPVP
jgi:hypothetical protein